MRLTCVLPHVAELTACEQLCSHQPWQEGRQKQDVQRRRVFFFFFISLTGKWIAGLLELRLRRPNRNCLRGFRNPPWVLFFNCFVRPAFRPSREEIKKKKTFCEKWAEGNGRGGEGGMEFCLADICGCLHWHSAKLPDFPSVQSITVQ